MHYVYQGGDSTRSNNRRRSRSGHLTVLSRPKCVETFRLHLLASGVSSARILAN